MYNITLIGMPGSGKSTVGVLLAKAWALAFWIPIWLFSSRKEPCFRIFWTAGAYPIFWTQRSGLCARSGVTTTSLPRAAAWSAGGSHGPSEGHGPVIYLRVPLEELKRRIHNLDSRGIALEPGQTLDDILTIRAPLYETYADYIVDALPGQELAQSVAQVLELVSAQ